MDNTRKGFKLTPTDKDKRIAELEATCNKWFEHLKNREEELLNELNNQNVKYNKQIEELEDKLANADYQLEGRDIKIKELETRCNELFLQTCEQAELIEKMKCCENCGWYYLQQHWRESKEINESRMFHCGTCGNKRNWKLREIKEK